MSPYWDQEDHDTMVEVSCMLNILSTSFTKPPPAHNCVVTGKYFFLSQPFLVPGPLTFNKA